MSDESPRIDLNDLLRKHAIDPEKVLVLRHRPPERELRKVLPWLAAEKHELFNAYQQIQTEKVEKAMTTCAYVASFIGHEPDRAMFIGLYSVGGWKPLTVREFRQVQAQIELMKFGMKGFTELTTCSGGGKDTLHQGMVGIRCFVPVIPRTSGSAFYRRCHPI